MKKILLSISVFVSASIGFSQCTDLFFSEYVEGTSQNKALEVYNPTTGAIDLSNYHILRYLNGGTAINDTLWMTGMLAPGATYNIVDPDTVTPPNATLLALADTLHTVTYYNGDDALALFHGTTMIDLIGDVGGADPGTQWPVDTGSTLNHTLVRKPTVFGGSTTWTAGALTWDVYAQNDFSHYGAHTMNACPAGAGIENESGWDVSIYPNPSSGQLNINSDVDNYSLQVIDLTGKIIINKNNLSETTQIDLSNMPNGIYMVKINNGGHQLTKKVIIRK